MFTNGTWVQAAFTTNIVIDIRGEVPREFAVPTNWSLTPSGLIGADRFRLMFITYAGFDSSETDISKYNEYVQSQAKATNAHTDIKPYHSTFRVLGSTADMDARDNTSTTSSDPSSVIYWLNGTKVADNYADLYDDLWDDEAHPRNRHGNTVSPGVVWTGSMIDGTEGGTQTQGSGALGRPFVVAGQLNGTGGPLDYGTALHNSSSAWPYYALSNIFVAPNTPATGQPTITGTPRVDEELTAETSGITDPEGTGNAVFTYQWTRVDGDTETDIQGATRSTYTPKTVDADQQIKVRVSFTDDRGHSEGPLVSEPTALIVGRDVLVKNTGLASDGSPQGLTNSRKLRAQAFTTGAFAEGYNLDAIGFLFNNIASTTTAGSHLTATLNEETSGDPGSVLCTLTDPTSFTSDGLQSFTAPTSGTACPTLSANTTYFAVIQRVTVTSDAITLKLTNSSGEDPGSLVEFSVGNDRHHSQTGTSWTDVSGQSYQIEVKGTSAVEPIVSDHRTWVDNRQGDAATTYENTGLFSIAQGFRTGDTAGIFEIHEIHVDFDSGHTDHHRVKVLITESTTPEADDNRGTPSGYSKGGQFYPQTVTSGGTVTFPRHSGHNWLEANRNYFLIISSKSASDDVGPTLRLTAYQGQTSDDGWAVDNHAYSKEKADHARWTKQDHPVRFRISGQFHQGLSLFEEPHAHESCPNKPCVVAVLETTENMEMEGRRFPGSMGTGNTWISTQENIEFKAALWPIPTGTQWVEFDYYTSSGSATAGEDFQNTSGTVRFSAGDKLKTIKVELIDDVHEDSGEFLQMNISRYTTDATVGGRIYETGDLKVRTSNGYSLPDVGKYLALGTIHNSEETTGARYIRVSGATVTEGKETAAEFTISLSGVLTAPVWFNYTTVDGSAVAGTHYTATSGETHIPHGATSVTVPVPILDHDDDVHTGDREFTLQLSKVTVAAIGTDSATVTIRDDEPQPLIARFTNLPEGNHGETSFNFDISFNQDVATQKLAMQNDVMTVTNGEITSAERVSGQSRLWRITVRPVDGRDVTVELPATTGCSATGAVHQRGRPPAALQQHHPHVQRHQAKRQVRPPQPPQRRRCLHRRAALQRRARHHRRRTAGPRHHHPGRQHHQRHRQKRRQQTRLDDHRPAQRPGQRGHQPQAPEELRHRRAYLHRGRRAAVQRPHQHGPRPGTAHGLGRRRHRRRRRKPDLHGHAQQGDPGQVLRQLCDLRRDGDSGRRLHRRQWRAGLHVWRRSPGRDRARAQRRGRRDRHPHALRPQPVRAYRRRRGHRHDSGRRPGAGHAQQPGDRPAVHHRHAKGR